MTFLSLAHTHTHSCSHFNIIKLIRRSHFCKLQLGNLVTCLKETHVNTPCNSVCFAKYFGFGVNNGRVIVSYALVRNPRCCIIKKPNICSLAHSDRSAVDWCNARIDFRTKKHTFSRRFKLIPTLFPCHMIPASSLPWNICWQGRSVLNGCDTPIRQTFDFKQHTEGPVDGRRPYRSFHLVF